jgi:precorrin-2 dehydrogenase/sirohydrochlorin ferrochelatase
VSAYYPIFLKLEAKRCLVVGGGAVAERKVQGLLEAKAEVVVVSPSLTDALRLWAVAGAISHVPRSFRDEDLKGCALVIGATDRVEVNRQVATAARRDGVWVNIVDTPAACDFIAPAVVRRGELQIAISTAGNSPTLAKRLRAGLEELIGPEYGEVAAVLGCLRAAVRRLREPPEVRKALFERLLDACRLPLIARQPVQHDAATAAACLKEELPRCTCATFIDQATRPRCSAPFCTSISASWSGCSSAPSALTSRRISG